MTELELSNLSVRLYFVHLQLIERAAALVPGRSVSDYVRDVLPMQAALDLGIELPHVPPVMRGRSAGLIAQAAHKLGITPSELTDRAARVFAARALGYDAQIEEALDLAPETPRAKSTPPQGRARSGTQRAVQSPARKAR